MTASWENVDRKTRVPPSGCNSMRGTTHRYSASGNTGEKELNIRGKLWPFLRNADAKSSSKNAENMFIFGEKATILGDLGALGQVWRRDWNRGGKKDPFAAKPSSILELILATVEHF